MQMGHPDTEDFNAKEKNIISTSAKYTSLISLKAHVLEVSVSYRGRHSDLDFRPRLAGLLGTIPD